MISKKQLQQDFEVIKKRIDKNEKLAWIRKRNRIEELVEKLQPIEDKVLELMAQKEPILDEINDMRLVMLKDCMHLEDYLLHHGSYIECKFCGTKIAINRALFPLNEETIKNPKV